MLRRLLMITHADMLAAGNQTMAATIKGYLNHGVEVLMVTTSPPAFENQALISKVLGDSNLEHFRKMNIPLNLFGLDLLARSLSRLLQCRPLKRRLVLGSTRDSSTLDVPLFAEFETSRCIKETVAWLFFQKQMFEAAKHLATEFRPDVVYGYEIYGAPVAVRLAKRLRVPSVTRFQGTVMYYGMSNPLLRLKMLRHVKGLSAKADLVIMADDGTRGMDVLKLLGVPQDRIRFWRNGTPLIEQCSEIEYQEARKAIERRYGIDKSKILLLVASRLERWKRADRAIRLLSDLESDDFRLLILGQGSEEKTLKELARSLAISGRIVFGGGVPHSQVMEAMKGADIILSLYDYSNLSNTVMEALKLGKPLVSIADGSLDGIVTNWDNAVLVPTRNLRAELLSCVLMLGKDLELRRAIGERAAIRARSDLWSWEERMNAEFDAVSSLL